MVEGQLFWERKLARMVRVFLIDDHQMMREGLKQLLESGESNVTVIGMAASAKDGLNQVSLMSPDLVILDLSLPERDGIWLAGELRETYPDLPLLALSMHLDKEKILGVLDAGANGYLTKSASKETLQYAIKTVMEGGSFLDPRITNIVLDGMRDSHTDDTGLTPRELDILKLVAADRSNEEVSDRLMISKGTVKAHLTAAFRKLGVKTRAGAVAKAIGLGLLDDDHHH